MDTPRVPDAGTIEGWLMPTATTRAMAARIRRELGTVPLEAVKHEIEEAAATMDQDHAGPEEPQGEPARRPRRLD